MTKEVTIRARPYDFSCDLERTALVMIDFQRDFFKQGGYGEALGNDPSLLYAAVDPAFNMMASCRLAGIHLVHTREGHLPDLSDCPESKRRGEVGKRIGDTGPMGRMLIRGEPGHEFIVPFIPSEDEVIIEKPGKGAFYDTGLDGVLRGMGIQYLMVTGVTTEVCVQSTVREASDRGYEVLLLEDCVASYKPDLHKAAIEMIVSQGGIFGRVTQSEEVLKALWSDEK